MKKHSFYRRLCSVVVAFSLLLSLGYIPVLAAYEEWDQNWMCQQQIKGNMVPIQGFSGAITLQLLQGDFFGSGELRAFDTNNGNNVVGPGGGGSTYINGYQFGATYGNDAVVKITANKNLKVRLRFNSDASQWATSTAFYHVVETADGERVTIKQVQLINGTMSKDLFTSEVSLAQGDTIYLIYHYTGTNTTGYGVASNFGLRIGVDVDAYSADERIVMAEWNQGWTVDRAIDANLEPVSALYDTIEYEMLQGDFFGAFSSLSRPTEYKASEHCVGTPGGGNTFINGYQFGAKNGTDAVMRITAKRDVQLTVRFQNDSANNWATGNTFYYVAQDANGAQTTIKELPITSGTMTKDQFNSVVHLAKGESLYIIYKYTGTSATGYGVTPTSLRLGVNTYEYDASKRPSYPIVEDLKHSDMVTNSVKEQGDKVTDDVVEYQFLYGSFANGTLQPFTVFGGDGTGSASDVVGDGNSGNYVKRWQWRACEMDTVLKITAREDIRIVLSHPSDLPTDAWATHSTYTLYAQNSEGRVVKLKEFPVVAAMDPTSINATVHLAAGDSIYMVYGLNEGATGTVTSSFMPQYNVHAGAYDASQRPVYRQDPTTCTHDYEATVITPAKTFTEGEMKYVCGICDHSYTEPIPATKTMKILVMGNSVSENTSLYLYEALKEMGVETVVVGNVQIGGTSFDDHWNRIQSGAADYTYRKNTSGEWVYSANKVSLLSALQDEAWDVIAINNRLAYAGQSSKFENMDNILDWLTEKRTNAFAEFAYLMPWALTEGSDYADFSTYYNKNQMAMYNATVSVTQSLIVPETRFAIILPVGTAIQNARTTALKGELDVDQVHLNTMGCYTAAMTVAAAVLNKPLDSFDWAPEGIPADCVAVAVESATNAIAKPFEVTQSQHTGEIDMPLIKEELKHSDMVTNSVKEQGNKVTDGAVEYQFLYGSFANGTLQPFTVFGGDGTGSASDVVGDGSSGNFVKRWQWRACEMDTVLKITALEDICIVLSHPSDLPTDAWATHSTYTLYAANSEGKIVKLKAFPVVAAMDPASINATIHLAAGDSIYMVYGLNEGATGTVTSSFLPQYTVHSGTGAYDASQRPVYRQDPATCTHDYEATVITPAKTFTEGEMKYVCGICDHSYTEPIPATKSIKILLVGNSHTRNFSTYLWDIMKDLGVETVIIGNANIEGTLMDTHYNNMLSGAANYTYYKNTDGNWNKTSNVRLADAVVDEEWDLITFQQRAFEAGVADVYGNIANVLAWLDSHKTNPNAVIYWPMTWAFQANCDHSSFETYYDSDQMQMYESIVDVVRNVVLPQALIEDVIPMGTAIQNARTSAIGDKLMIDGVHANSMGCYIAGVTFAGKVLDIDVSALDWAPEGIPADCVAVAVESAANAIAKPFEVTQSQYTGEIDMPLIKEDLQHYDMVTNTVKKQGGKVTDDAVEYQFLYGSFANGTLQPFTVFGGDGTGSASDVVGDSNSDNFVKRWQWRACEMDTVLKITALEDIRIVLSHPSDLPTDAWATHSTYTLYAANSEGKIVKLKAFPVVAAMDPASINATIHLAAGDSIYMVYGLNEGATGTVTSSFLPQYTVHSGTGAYDANLRTDFVICDHAGDKLTYQHNDEQHWQVCSCGEYTSEKTPHDGNNTCICGYTKHEKLEHPYMVSLAVKANGSAVEQDMVSFQYLFGNFAAGNLSPFTTFGGADTSSEEDDRLGAEDGSNVIWRWQWRACEMDTVLKITALEDVRIVLSHPENLPTDAWATDSTYTLYAVDSQGRVVKLKEFPVVEAMDPASISATIHMAAGDSIYMVYGLNEGATDTMTSNFIPCYTVYGGADAYDASLRPDFETASDIPACNHAGDKLTYQHDNDQHWKVCSCGEYTSEKAPHDGNDTCVCGYVKPERTDYLEHPDLVSLAVKANGSAVERELFSFQYLFGDFAAGSLAPFTTFGGVDTSSEDDDRLGAENGSNAIWRWQWRCGSKNTVLKVTAKENVKLDLAALAVQDSQWAMGTAYRIYVENAEGVKVLLKTIDVKEAFDHEEASLTVHLVAGQNLYVVYGNSYGKYTDESPATSHYMPVFTVNANQFDANKSVDFDEVPDTGDEANLATAIALVMLSLFACCALIEDKKHIIR